MLHSSRRDRKAKAIAEVLAKMADATPPLAPHRPRPILETEEWLVESATEFIETLEKYYAERAKQMRVGAQASVLAKSCEPHRIDWR